MMIFKIALGLLLSVTAMAEGTSINQVLNVPFYVESIAAMHIDVINNEFNRAGAKYNCLNIKLGADIKKQPKTSWGGLGNTTPGTLQVSYKNNCNAASVIFGIDSIGYDEDYTHAIIKFTDSAGSVTKDDFCVYGLHEEVRKCPKEVGTLTNFSTPAKGR